MERITEKLLSNTVGQVNGMLNGLTVSIAYHSGRSHLNLSDDRGIIRTLRAGTKREMFEYLNAMRETLYIVGRD